MTVAVQVAGSVAASDNLAKLRKKMTDLVSVLEISVGFSVDLYHIIRNNSIERQYWREA